MAQPSRNETSRAAEMRYSFVPPDEYSNLGIDLTGSSPDMEFCWVTTNVAGMSTEREMMKAMRSGYEPATKADCPRALLPDLPGRPKRDENAPIEVHDAMLFKRPKMIGERERQYYREQTAAALKTATHRLQNIESASGESAMDGQDFFAISANRVGLSESAGRLRINSIEE